MEPVQPGYGRSRMPVRRVDWLAIAQLVVSALGLGVFLLFSLMFFVMGIMALVRRDMPVQLGVTSVFSLAWVSVLLSVLALVSVIYAIREINGKDRSASSGFWGSKWFLVASGLLMLVPLVLLAGNAVAKQGRIAWLLLPPLQLLVVVLPLWWMVESARRRLPRNSPQRTWGMLTFSLLITSQVIVVVEIVGIVLAGIIVVVILAMQPGAASELERLATRLMNSQMDPEILVRVMRPFMQQPWVIFGILALGAGVVPLVEELLKPLGLWALLGRKLTPAEGFVMGAVCGAGFALLESLGNLSGPLTDGWLGLAAGRIGTGMLHVTCSAMVGWGMASAWHEGNYLRLGGTYALAVLLHGIWNVFGLLMGIVPILQGNSLLLRLGQAAPYALAGLGVVLLAILLALNYSIRKAALHAALVPAEAAAAVIPALSIEPTEQTEPVGAPDSLENLDKPVDKV
ncbi:MAG TPA: PrsW family glutamic-type intramembrane protease [Anaerolineaceae bacterium]